MARWDPPGYGFCVMERDQGLVVGDTSFLPALVYDGECGFCTWTVELIRARLRESVLLVPWQRVDLDHVGLSANEARQAAWWIEPDGKKYRGHRAVARALRACRYPWRAVGVVLQWPLIRAVAAPLYGFVSRHRAHLPGTIPAVPSTPTTGHRRRRDRETDG